MIGLSGAHRSGKTTLARSVAEEQDNLEYVSLDVRGVTEAAGTTFAEMAQCFHKRMEVQRRLIARCHELFVGRKRPFISDRTPIDVAAYLLCEVNSQTEERYHEEIVQMLEDCLDITNASFGAIILVEPHLPFVVEKGVPGPNPAYQWHLHYACAGLVSDPRLKVDWFAFGPKLTDLEERTEAVLEIYDDVIEESVHSAAASSHH